MCVCVSVCVCVCVCVWGGGGVHSLGTWTYSHTVEFVDGDWKHIDFLATFSKCKYTGLYDSNEICRKQKEASNAIQTTQSKATQHTQHVPVD